MSRRLIPVLAGLAAGTSVFSLLRWRRNRPSQNGTEASRRTLDRVDEADLESFPASDPPSWTLGEEPTD